MWFLVERKHIVRWHRMGKKYVIFFTIIFTFSYLCVCVCVLSLFKCNVLCFVSIFCSSYVCFYDFMLVNNVIVNIEYRYSKLIVEMNSPNFTVFIENFNVWGCISFLLWWYTIYLRNYAFMCVVTIFSLFNCLYAIIYFSFQNNMDLYATLLLWAKQWRSYGDNLSWVLFWRVIGERLLWLLCRLCLIARIVNGRRWRWWLNRLIWKC